MLKKLCLLSASALFLVSVSSTGWARMTADEIARLGQDLTPMGAIKAGNIFLS